MRRQQMALSGPKMIKNRPRCRGAARKSGRDWRVETAQEREYDGRGFWQCAVHGAVPNSRAAPCHTAASSRGSCAGTAGSARADPVLELEFSGRFLPEMGKIYHESPDPLIRGGCWHAGTGMVPRPTPARRT